VQEQRKALKTYTIKVGEEEDFYLDLPQHIGINR
jgi:hypothetical protein